MKSWFRTPIFWVSVSALAFFSFYGVVLVFRHLNYYTAQLDLGNMEQVMWQSLHGHWFKMIDSTNGNLISRFSYHADVLLLIYLPFYAIVQHPTTLTILQLLFVTSAVFPLFWFGKKMLPEWIAACFAVTLLLYPPLIWNILFDVHAVTLVIPLLIWAAWAIQERRMSIYWFSVALLPLAKEEVGITVALFGLAVLWKIRPRWIGITTMLYGAAVSLLMLFVVIPHVRGSADHFFIEQYSAFGTTTAGVVRGMATHPLQVLRTMLNGEGRAYLLHMFGPLGGISLLGFPYLLLATPEYAVNTLSSFQGMRTIVFQYTSVLTPIILLTGVIGFSRWWNWTSRWRMLQRLGLIGVLAASLFFFWHDAPFAFSRHSEILNVFTPSPYRSDIATIKKDVTPDDKISIVNNLGPQFNQRAAVWGFPVKIDESNVIIALIKSDDTSEWATRARATLQQLRTSTAWKIKLEHNELLYLRRVE